MQVLKHTGITYEPNLIGFMNEIARRFTGASNASSFSMLANGYDLNPPTTRIGNRGFRAEFDDGSNLQVRHYVAGLISGRNLGTTAGLTQMNSRESNTLRADQIDRALNAVSTRHGGDLTANNFRQLADWIRREICAP